jgi:hypothetical protein
MNAMGVAVGFGCCGQVGGRVVVIEAGVCGGGGRGWSLRCVWGVAVGPGRAGQFQGRESLIHKGITTKPL